MEWQIGAAGYCRRELRYQEPEPIERVDAERIFLTGTPEEICDALIGVTFHDPDWRWVQEHCLEFLNHENADVRRLAATCLGHIARIHRQLDRDVVVPALKRLEADPEVAGTASDALDDIRMFLE
jgi:HEAT repeat